MLKSLYTKIIFILSFILFSNVTAQSGDISIGFEFLAGPQFSYLNFSNNSLNYKTTSNNDVRVGLTIGDYEGFTGSILIGKNNFKSQYTNEDITSTIELGYTIIDVPLRYSFANYSLSDAVESASIGGSIWVRNYSSQITNDMIVRNSRMFQLNTLAVYGDIVFKGWDLDEGKVNPYIYFRQTLGGIEVWDTDEGSNFTQIGAGIKLSMIWD